MVDVMVQLISYIIPVMIGVFGYFFVRQIVQGKHVARMEQRLDDKDRQCDERLKWMRSIDTKLDSVSGTTNKILGYMERNQRT